MTSVPERITALETKMQHQSERIEHYGTLVMELHSHFLKNQGAKEASKETAVSRHMFVVGISAAVSATIAFISRMAPHVDAFQK